MVGQSRRDRERSTAVIGIVGEAGRRGHKINPSTRRTCRSRRCPREQTSFTERPRPASGSCRTGSHRKAPAGADGYRFGIRHGLSGRPAARAGHTRIASQRSGGSTLPRQGITGQLLPNYDNEQIVAAAQCHAFVARRDYYLTVWGPYQPKPVWVREDYLLDQQSEKKVSEEANYRNRRIIFDLESERRRLEQKI